MATFIYGDDQAGFIKAESTYGTPVKATATDAIRTVSLPMAPVANRIDVPDEKNTRSLVTTLAGRTSGTWGATCLFRPSESLGVAPDLSALLTLFFTETVNAGTSVVYTLLKDTTAKSASIYRNLGAALHEFVYGAIGQSFTLRWGGNEITTIECAGVAKAFGRTTSNSLANGAGSTVTALVLDDADDVSVYSLVEIGGDDNSGAGHQITAIAHSTQTATLEATHSWSDNDTVVPFLPSPTYSGGAPIYGVDGSLSFDGGSTTVKHIMGSIAMVPNMDLVNEEFGSSSPSDVMLAPGKRTCQLSLEMLVKKSELYMFSEFQRKVTKDMRCNIGTTTGSRLELDANIVEFDPITIDPGESGAARVTLTGKCRASASHEDEFSLTLI